MPVPFSYMISHIDLSQEQALPELGLEQHGNYLVFWWKDIALGHTFVDPGEKLTVQEYQERLVAAVQPAVDFYAGQQQNVQAEGWQELLNQNLVGWQNWMEKVFTGWTVSELPATVPVSVIICTRNRAPILHRCLSLLSTQTSRPEEIIVVDNAPADESTRDVVQQFDSVTYILEPTPGLSYARNTGLLKATQPVIAFTDDDVLVQDNWVYRTWETFTDSNVKASTGLVVASELKSETQLIFEKYWSFNRGFVDKVYDQEFFTQTLAQGPPVWEIGAGANMAFRGDIFDEVGLFDERLGAGASGCSEDSEMWYRILEAGHTIVYNPRAVVHHEHRRELEGLKKQIFSYMRGFTAAALMQQQRRQEAGYKRHLFSVLPKYYFRLLYRGFPRYRFRFRTIATELRGMVSGLIFYLRNKNSSAKLR